MNQRTRLLLFGGISALLLVIFISLPLRHVFAAGTIVDTSTLSLRLTPNPYRYQVVEIANGQVLVAEKASIVQINGTSYTTQQATNITTTATSLTADLVLNGTNALAHVVFTFTTPQILHVALTVPGQTPGQVTEQFTDQGEHYYGIWEYPFNGNLDDRGISHNYSGIGGAPNVNVDSARAPFYMTSRSYAIYAETTAHGHYSVAVNGVTSFEFEDTHLTYDIIFGPTYADMLSRYNTLAGGAFMPPQWAFDSIWWQGDDHQDWHNATNAQQNVLDHANQLQHYQIPASAIEIDNPYSTGVGWGNFDFDPSFPNPPQMMSDLQARGIHPILWIANRAWDNLYIEASAAGYLFPGISAAKGPALDMRNPAAYTFFQGKLNTFINLGVTGYKIDRGDEGEMPDAVQNQNVTLFDQMAAQGLAAQDGTNGFIYARDVSDHSRGSVAVWNGDSDPTFAGLSYSIAGGLRSGTINFPMWGSDTGGENRTSTDPTEELFARWFEFSAYSTMMEVKIGNGHTPWYNYDNTMITIARDQSVAHHDLIPYTQSMVYNATQTGMPAMRALILAYPDDPNVVNTTDEYLYGSEFLVAPVITAGATSRQVYLPAGNWINLNDNATIYQGGQTITAQAPLATIPRFAREGAIIPHGDILKSNNNWTPNWTPQLNVAVYPSNSIANTFNYYTGSTVVPITSSTAGGTTTIQFGNLGNTGNLEIHLAGFTGVQRNNTTLVNGTDYTYNPSTHLLTIPYTGATTVQITGMQSLFGGTTVPTPTPTVGVPTATPTIGAPTPTATPISGLPQITNLNVADTANAGAWSVQNTLQVGSVEYGDRGYTFSTVPATLIGDNWIRTANNSKSSTLDPLTTFTLNQAANVYVAEDTRLAKPAWMDATWTDSGLTMKSSGGATYRLYVKAYVAGTVTLGPASPVGTNTSMYTVIVG